jgi:hypothetical protein
MRVHRLILLEAVRRLGLPGAIGAALIAVAVGYAVVAVLPARDEAARLAVQAERAEARVARIRSGAEAPPEPAAQRLDAFHRSLPEQALATEAIDRIFAAAEAERLSLSRGEYALVIDPEPGLARYQILLPVRGTYPQLRRFLGAALDAVPALGLEDIDFQRKQIGETELEGRIRMTLYLSRR